jgi:uncharacterized protein involved in exopolysaccharide biosynthesis
MIRQIVLLAAVFILPAGVATAVIWTQVMPEYRATAEVRIRPFVPYLVFETEENGTIRQYESFKRTQASIMRSVTVLRRVVDEAVIQQTQWYSEPGQSLIRRLQGRPPASHTERLRKALTVRAREGTEIIDVFFTGFGREDARTIVDAVLEEYIQYTGQKHDAEKDALYRKLVEQCKVLEREIKGREATIDRLEEALGTGSPEELISKMRLGIEDTEARIREVRGDMKLLEWESVQEEATVSNGETADSSEERGKEPRYYEDSDWRKLDRDVRAIGHEIAVSELEPNNPEMVLARKDLEFAKELLELREAQLDEQWKEEQRQDARQNSKSGAAVIRSGSGVREAVISFEHRLKWAKEELRQLEGGLEEQEEEFQRCFAEARLLEKENEELEYKRELLKAVRRRLERKKMEGSISGAIEILTPAFAPSEPFKDRRMMYTGIVAGLSVLGLALAGWVLHRHGFL